MATVQDVDDFLRGLDPDARHDNSPDGLTWGDPNMEVRAIGATWMASMDHSHSRTGLAFMRRRHHGEREGDNAQMEGRRRNPEGVRN